MNNRKKILTLGLATTITITGFLGNNCFAHSLESLGRPVAGYENANDFIQNSFDAATAGVEVIFKYDPHETYKIYCEDGFVTDVQFKSGEKVEYVGAGDTSRWIIDQSTSGVGLTKTEHVYIKPIKRGLSTNIIINTNKHTYQINAISGSQYNPIVSWEADTVSDHLQRLTYQKDIENAMSVDAMSLHFGYKIKHGSYPWSPVQAFDDGHKTYFKMKPDIKSSDAPVFLVLEKGKTILTNYRIIGNYYVVDRIFDNAEFLVGNSKVEIKRR